MKPTMSYELATALCDLWGIDVSTVRSIKIDLQAGQPVNIFIETVDIQRRDGDGIYESLAHYQLVPK